MKVVVITGTPGTGKTLIAKKLSLLLDYTYFDVNSFIKTAHLYSSYDSKRHSYVVDPSSLVKKLLKVREKAIKSGSKGIIFDSHLAHFLPAKYVDVCVVVTCSLKVLSRRLKKRGYSLSKIRENLDAEIFEICRLEAAEMGHKPLILDTSVVSKASIKKLAAKIKRLVG